MSTNQAWEKWMWRDWKSDPAVRKLSAPCRAIWFEMLGDMWLEEAFSWSGNLGDIMTLANASEEDVDLFLEEVPATGVCDISVTVTESHKHVTVISRRKQREEKDRESARLRQRRARAKKAGHALSQGESESESESESEERTPPPPDPDLDPTSQSRGGGEVDSPQAGSSTAPCPQRKIIDLYHQICPHFPRVRKAAICEVATRARWREVVTGEDRDNGIRETRAPDLALAWFENFFIRVDRSEFMHGRQPGGSGHPPRWLCLAWLMNRTNFYKVLEGRYDG